MSQLKHKVSVWGAIVAFSLGLMLIICLTPIFGVSAAIGEIPIVTVEGGSELPQKALTGTKITLPNATATKADGVTSLPVTVRVSLNQKDITVSDQAGYTLDKKGLYNIYYEAYDEESEFYGFESYDIDVRDVWLGIKLSSVNPAEATVGSPIILAKASATDFGGEIISKLNVELTVKFGDLPIDIVESSFTPLRQGKYIVTYKTEERGEVVTLVNEIVVTGTMPTISVQNIPGTIFLKQEYTLPLAEAFDVNGGIVTVTVGVTFNGENIDVNNYKFTPKKTGKYTIVYTATNSKGIPASVTRVVECVKPKASVGLIVGLSVGIGGGAIIIAGGVLLFFFLRKKKAQAKNKITLDEEKTIENSDVTEKED